MSKMTVLLILVWNVSVNIAFMELHADHVHFKHCGIGFLKLVPCLLKLFVIISLYSSEIMTTCAVHVCNICR